MALILSIPLTVTLNGNSSPEVANSLPESSTIKTSPVPDLLTSRSRRKPLNETKLKSVASIP